MNKGFLSYQNELEIYRRNYMFSTPKDNSTLIKTQNINEEKINFIRYDIKKREFKKVIKQYFPTIVECYKSTHEKFKYRKLQLPHIEKPICLFVIGARGRLSSLSSFLRRNAFLYTVGFEPDIEELHRLEIARAYDLVLPFALGYKHAEKEFYLTKERGCSSLLRPNMQTIKHLSTRPDWFEIEKSINIETHRFDDIYNHNSKIKDIPNMLQVDVQGYELEILKGFGILLKKVKIIMMEIVFYPIYLQQPSFHKIHDFMTQNDFILFSIDKQGVFGNNFVEGNAIYINNNYYRSINGESITDKIDMFCLDHCKHIFH